jgi:FkbM family methyltransferase
MSVQKRLNRLWKNMFPSHFSAKEGARWLCRCCGLDVRLRKLDRVRGLNLQDDVSVLIGSDTPMVFDVGAHRGETLFKIYNSFKRPTVHAFEPSPESYDFLTRHFSGWFNLTLNNVALGAADSDMPFFCYDGSPIHSLLEIDRHADNVLKDARLVETIRVKVMTVDDYCATRKISRVSWLKIDTQGNDSNVLRGATHLLEQSGIDLISLEVNIMPMYHGEGGIVEVLELLGKYNYRLVDVYDKNYRRNMLSCCDLLFVHSSN